MNNTIYLRGMEYFAYHGVLREERELGQRFVVDVELTLTNNGVFSRDDLDLTVDYSQVYAKIAEVMTRTAHTIEFVAEQIAREILTDFACTSVRVEVHKPAAPIQGVFSDVAVAIVRTNVWRAYLSVGSNLGDRTAHLRDALGKLGGIGVIREISHVYETEPVGDIEQGWFYNLVAELETPLPPLALLEKCQQIEALCGRKRDSLTPITRWGSRTLDIDILLLLRGPGQQGECIKTEKLLIPHPPMEQREFVLAPLREIAPSLVLPSGREARQTTGEGQVTCLNAPYFSVADFSG